MKEKSSEEQAKKGERGRKGLDIVKIQYGNVIIKPLSFGTQYNKIHAYTL